MRAEVAQAAKGRSTDAEAHRLYLHGRHMAERLTTDGLAAGVAYLRQALERDPDYALAWASLSRALALEAALGAAPVPEGNERAREAARKALALEPALAEGHVALGLIQMWYDWDWKAAEASLRRALELAPGNVEAWDLSGLLAYDFGRIEDALMRARHATELDPLSVAAHLNLGRVHRAADNLAEAEKEFRHARELSAGAAAAASCSPRRSSSRGSTRRRLRASRSSRATGRDCAGSRSFTTRRGAMRSRTPRSRS